MEKADLKRVMVSCFPSPLEAGHQLRKKSASFAAKSDLEWVRKSFRLIRRVR